MEYYSATKKDEVLTHATTWMNFGNIMLGERSQTQKSIYRMLFIGNVQSRKIYRDRK